MTTEPPPRSRVKQLRIVLWIAVVLALAVFGAFLLLRNAGHGNRQPSAAPAQSSFGGPFTLTGADGKTFSSAKLLGKPYAIYFGFTRCGDVCPTTLSRLVKLRNQVGGDDAFRIVFVTIDPENDGPKEVGQYASLFNSPIVGLTGTPAQIAAMAKAYKVYYAKRPMGSTYLMDHASPVYLIGPDGRFRTLVSSNDGLDSLVASIAGAIGRS
jgi:protein SCO1